jgi:hypothetical protein
VLKRRQGIVTVYRVIVERRPARTGRRFRQRAFGMVGAETVAAVDLPDVQAG